MGDEGGKAVGGEEGEWLEKGCFVCVFIQTHDMARAGWMRAKKGVLGDG
jgi:hypothetical protein